MSLVRVTVLLSLVCLLCVSVSTQNWHFSNGWESGKRSSPLNNCQFRPQVKALVSRIIEEEIARLQRVCSRPAYPVPDTQAYLQGPREITMYALSPNYQPHGILQHVCPVIHHYWPSMTFDIFFREKTDKRLSQTSEAL